MVGAISFSVLMFAQAGGTASSCDQPQAAALAEQARQAASERHFDAAASKLQQAWVVCPGNTGLLVERANALFMAQRFADARAVAKTVLHSDPQNAAALKIRGNSEYLLNEVSEAVTTFVTLLERHPDDADGAYMLGRIYYQEGRLDQATGQFQRALKLNPQSYKVWDNLGLCWQASGDNDKAIAHFLHANKLAEKDHPEYDWAYANLAELFLSMDDAERAFAAASKAANRNPLSARNFYIGGKALEKLGKTELSMNWFERAAALDSTRSDTQYKLMYLYSRLGQQEKAEQARRKFLELKAKEPAKRR
jgi:tetratricopeptide (TPR) repeat protein